MPLVPPLAVLLVVAALLAVRRVRGRTLPAWAVALAGALLLVATGGVPPAGAVAAIDGGVLATLAVLFVVGAGLGRSQLADEAAASLLLLGPDRRALAAGIDWRTLLLFAGLFVMTAGVRSSGLVEASFGGAAGSIAVLMATAVVGSQIVSNVPLVAIALPFVEPHGTTALMALAAGSTIAGHLTILGAASNLIVLESAERMGVTVSVRAFVRFGLPLVLVQGLCYWIWLALVG